MSFMINNTNDRNDMKMVFETISTGIGIFTSLIMGEMPIKITVRLILPHNCQNGYCPKAYNNKYYYPI